MLLVHTPGQLTPCLEHNAVKGISPTGIHQQISNRPSLTFVGQQFGIVVFFEAIENDSRKNCGNESEKWRCSEAPSSDIGWKKNGSYTFDFRDQPLVRLASNWHRCHERHPIHTYVVRDAALAAKLVTRYRISVRKFLPRRNRDCSTETIQFTLKYCLHNCFDDMLTGVT